MCTTCPDITKPYILPHIWFPRTVTRNTQCLPTENYLWVLLKEMGIFLCEPEPCDFHIIYKNVSGEMVKKVASFSFRCKNYFLFSIHCIRLGENILYLLKHSLAT